MQCFGEWSTDLRRAGDTLRIGYGEPARSFYVLLDQ